MPAEPALLLTCEHAGNRVPPAWRARFAGRRRLLASHRGWDPGALAVARRLARATGAPLIAAPTTRLLVDPNRSEHNPTVFSELTRGLSHEEREALLDRYHRPHWARVRRAVAAAPDGVLHVAVHSFTPVWRGSPRDFELGILYDPARRRERALGRAWQRRLRETRPALRVRRNAPYRGTADGLTTALRREWPVGRYRGLELELNQRWIATPAGIRRAADAIATLLD